MRMFATKLRIFSVLLIVSSIVRDNLGMKAWECGREVNDVIAIDLTSPGECEKGKEDYNEPVNMKVQLIYEEDEFTVDVRHCSAVVDRFVTYCSSYWSWSYGK
jgi:hypothetical protein